MKPFLIGGVALLGAVGLGWFLTENDLALQAHFAPRYEQVRRNTFEHSRAFNAGMIQELENMQREYVQEKDPTARQALAAIIRHRASGYNLNDPDVTFELRQFIQSIQ